MMMLQAYSSKWADYIQVQKKQVCKINWRAWLCLCSFMSEISWRIVFPDDSSERNIDDILREAECLLDGQQAHLQSRSKSSSISSRSESEASGTSDQRFLTTTNLVHSSSLGLESDSKQPRFDHFSAESSTLASLLQNQQEKFVPPHLVGTPLEATYKRIYEQIRKEVDGTLKPQLTGDFPDLRLSLPVPGLDTPSFDVPGCFNLEQEFLEERKRCLKLKGMQSSIFPCIYSSY